MQGERPMAAQNKSIGQFNLTGIAPARRGVPQIEVTFDIDANGILKVSAKDKATGKEQAIRIEASSGLSKDEIDRMKAEAEANAEADKKEREKVDKLNQADSLIFTTENQLKDLGDKIPADKKAPIEAALQKLKDAHKAQDLAGIEPHSKPQVLRCMHKPEHKAVHKLVRTQVRLTITRTPETTKTTFRTLTLRK